MILRLLLELRAWARLAGMIVLIAAGLIVLRLGFARWAPARQRRVKQIWARLLLHALGVRVARARRARLTRGRLLVANHISWLDVFVLNALTPATFVCKDDVRHWPVLGWLVAASGTLFIERGNRAAAARTASQIAQRLRSGENVVVFPEGTTTRGTHLLPFRAALFQGAVEAGVGVQPIALRYLDRRNAACHAPAYDGDVSFGESLLAIVRAPWLRADAHWLPRLSASSERRMLAQSAEDAIAAHLGFVRLGAESPLSACPREGETEGSTVET